MGSRENNDEVLMLPADCTVLITSNKITCNRLLFGVSLYLLITFIKYESQYEYDCV